MYMYRGKDMYVYMFTDMMYTGNRGTYGREAPARLHSGTPFRVLV